ncbi:MAG: hypothetical protein GF309_08025, partial [Candidatus Lokiarchaeota archaeon]|nr:hypothetical protein [Candidatus Lokiarchaeota archaeon]
MQVGKQGKAQVVQGCPCFRPLHHEYTDDERRILCVNDEDVREMKLSAFPSWKHAMLEKNEDRKRFRAVNRKLCYATVYLDSSYGCVYCVFQGWPLRIHERDVAPEDVRDTAAAMLGNMTRIWLEPGPPVDLALIRRRILDAEEYKPEWKYYRLMQYLPELLG